MRKLHYSHAKCYLLSVIVCLCTAFSAVGQILIATTPATGCKSSDGTATISVNNPGGVFKFEYNVDGNINTSGSFPNLSVGKHTATVKDVNTGCSFSQEFEIKSPESSLDVTISGNNGPISFLVCSGAPSLTLNATASGGSGNYDYTWKGGSITVSSTGRYPVTATDNVTKCTADESVYVVFVPIICSRDPNDIIGPEGYGPGKMIAKSKTHSYMIRFENDPDFATAPAQVVKINHPLDSNLNLFSLRLGSFSFGGLTFTVPPDKTFYSTRLNVLDSLGVVVDVTAGIDATKREAFWIFESKDPATGLPPANAQLGFLPVNDSSARGEGYVTYTVKAANHTQTGDSIHAKATIVFDLNAPIETPVIFNTIDAVAPASHVTALPATSDSAAISVKWSGTDDPGGSGIRDYTLYVSENGGVFSVYQSGLTNTVTTFTGILGNTYSFFTRASDSTGNEEALKNAAEATITIGATCPDNLKITYYRDADGDGYGTNTDTVSNCTPPSGYIVQGGDCNDADNDIHPGATEVCNGKDDNCDGEIDEGIQPITLYWDNDNDGYGSPDSSIQACNSLAGYVTHNTDCNDSDSTVHPGAPELCNGIDDNCNGKVDEGLQTVFYNDADHDGYGTAADTVQACAAPAGYVTNNTDCNDADSTVHPGAPELCNGIDDDCDGKVDEGLQLVFYRDADNDGYGNLSDTVHACSAPEGYVADNSDCNDNNETVHPGATEVINGIDDDCDDQVDEGNIPQPPVVNITGPADSVTYLAPVNIMLTASAFDQDGITKVEFYNGTTLLAIEQYLPYTFKWKGVTVGEYDITAKAYDSSGLFSFSSPIHISVVPNQPPSVNIIKPVDGEDFAAPGSILIKADAHDVDGIIKSVELYNGTTLLRTEKYPGYSWRWKDVPAGEYVITAWATDDYGAVTVSDPVHITVITNQPPTVNITSPANGATFLQPVPIVLSAEAHDPDGTIKNVTFYNGDSLIFTELEAPFYRLWRHKLPAGDYTITAVATDNFGLQITSAPVQIHIIPNQPPVVNVLSPANGESYTAPASIVIKADAQDHDGTIKSVEFYNGTMLLHTEKYPGYSWRWNDVPEGEYTITARATDNFGQISISAPVMVTVTPPLAQVLSRKLPGADNKTDLTKILNIRLIPNPAKNTLNLYTTGFKKNKQLMVSVISPFRSSDKDKTIKQFYAEFSTKCCLPGKWSIYDKSNK